MIYYFINSFISPRNYETIIQLGIAIKNCFACKTLLNPHVFEVECDSLQAKNRNFLIFFFFLEGMGVGAGVALQKGKKGIEFITKLAEIIVITILIKFNKTMSLSNTVPSKILATRCFFTNQLKHKTVNQTTCRMPSANP